MSVYVIIDINTTDYAAYEDYMRLAPSSLRAYDGRLVANNSATEVLEGIWQPGNVLIVEFPGIAYARQWWQSEEYATAKLIRQLTTDTNMVIVGNEEAE